jgi:hypothetical protein
MAEKSSWDQAYIQQKLGLVWRNRIKLSKLSKTTFTYRSSSLLFYGLNPFINLTFACNCVSMSSFSSLNPLTYLTFLSCVLVLLLVLHIPGIFVLCPRPPPCPPHTWHFCPVSSSSSLSSSALLAFVPTRMATRLK